MTDRRIMNRRAAMTMAASATMAAGVGATAAGATVAPAERPRRMIAVGGVTLGTGAPKTIVSIIAADRATILARAAALRANPAVDLVELRADHLTAALDTAQVAQTAAAVRRALGGKPLIFTFRSKREGGHTAIDDASYAALCDAVLAAGGADLLDLEIARIGAAPAVAAVLRRAKAQGVFTIGSSHDFDRTPSVAQMIATLRRAQALGADIPKIAVMPHDPGDVLHLLEATWAFVRDDARGPVITISMGRLGGVSRLAGTAFGSAATFGADGPVSAPGQLSIGALRPILDELDGKAAS